MKPMLIEKCRDYLLARAVAESLPQEPPPLRAITISRETGAGAITIGQLVAEYLEQKAGPGTGNAWAVFDRELVKKVLTDHQLPGSTERYMPEGSVNSIHDYLEELLGVHPSSWTLLQHTNHTILKLANAGNVIIVGRGAHLITAPLKHVFHVRLVAPVEFRVRHCEEYYHLKHREAVEFVEKRDRARELYIRKNFRSRVQDPLQFHITVNTERIAFPEVARLIGDAALNMPVVKPRPSRVSG